MCYLDDKVPVTKPPISCKFQLVAIHSMYMKFVLKLYISLT